ncbi:helix-turn-helix transcriptional regulator [Blautia sp. Sow4_E7]|uniref:helix-turn-helix transcriptional regulator n=1 Tax=Blautia sp. Sow4_E7 TaxID=3438749 RepID=UPI003F8FB29A
MDINYHYLLEHISHQLHTFVKTWTGNEPMPSQSQIETICVRSDLKDHYLSTSDFLTFLAAQPEDASLHCPLLFSVKAGEKELMYGYVSAQEHHFLVGPLLLSNAMQLNVQLPPAKNLQAISDEDMAALFTCHLYFFCDNLLLLHNLFREKTLLRDELIYRNCTTRMSKTEIMTDYSNLVFQRQEMNEPHNPYDQELREGSSIENGDIEMLKKSINEDYKGKLGTLAKNELRNAKNLGIVLMTLASRAAIRGGLLPEIAYSMSDVYIQKIEEMTDSAVIYSVIRQYEIEYAQAVADLKSKDSQQKKRQNIWTEQAKDYIFCHLHEKIRIQDIAESLHLNANYLSELFKTQEKITLTDFILKEKVKLTQNLLTYSPYSYIEIATYLGFSSQSHLGKVFRKYTGMTLRQYREAYGVNNNRR